MTNQAVILAGGKGTRLGKLARHCPKPLLPVGEVPFIEYLIGELARHGLSRMVLLVGPFRDQFMEVLGDGSRFGVSINFVSEPEPAGTAGALSHAVDLLEESFLFLNGDSFFSFNFLFLSHMAEQQGCIAAMALRVVDDVSRYGSVKMEGERVMEFTEKRQGAGPGCINAGVYYLSSEVLDLIDHIPMSLEQDVLPKLAREGRLCGRAYDVPFIDIGVPDDFERAQTLLPQWQHRAAMFIDADCLATSGGGGTATTGWRQLGEEILSCNERGDYVICLAGQLTGQAPIDFLSGLNKMLSPLCAHVDALFHDFSTHDNMTIMGCPRTYCGTLEDALRLWPIDTERSILMSANDEYITIAKMNGIQCVHSNTVAICRK